MMTFTLDLSDLVPLTDERFEALCRRHRDYRLERTSRGELLLMPPAGGESSRRNCELSRRLGNWAADRAWVAFDSSGGFKLPSGAIRSPDASLLATSRWEALSTKERQGFLPLCPDLVVEIASPSDSIEELRAKMREYQENGARLGWLIFDRQVEVYRADGSCVVLEQPRQLSGSEDLFPGLVLELDGILQ